MLPADSVLLRNLVNRNFYMRAEEVTHVVCVVNLVETALAEVFVIILAVELRNSFTILLTYDIRVLAQAGINRDLCLNLVKKLSTLWVENQVSMLIDTLRM